MAGINKVIIVGNLGKDPEVTYVPSGAAVAKFSVATSETWKDKTSGEKKERTEWHRIVAWDKLGEICGKYLSKGRRSTSRASCKPIPTMTRKVSSVTSPRSSRRTCSSWAEKGMPRTRVAPAGARPSANRPGGVGPPAGKMISRFDGD